MWIETRLVAAMRWQRESGDTDHLQGRLLTMQPDTRGTTSTFDQRLAQ